jgi:PAS domain S-box-containing protein
MVETMGDGAVTITPDGVILYCNRRFADLVEADLQQVIGSPVQRFLGLGEADKFAALMQQALVDVASGRINLLRSNGTGVPIHVALRALDTGASRNVVVVVTDLTEIAAAQEKLTALYRDRELQFHESLSTYSTQIGTAGAVDINGEKEGLQTLKILILEDEPTDAELMQRELREAGVDFTATRVANRAAFIAALEAFAPDIVLADYKLPDFNGAEALAHVRQVHPEVPAVMVTGALGDEGAVALLKAGAADYVLKGNLPRLAPAVRRAISVERGIRARKAAERAVRGANALLQITEKSADIGSFDWDIASGECLWSGEVYRIFARIPGEFVPTLGKFLECVHSDDRARLQDAIDAALTRNQPLNIEFRIVRPDNTERIIHSLDEVFRDKTGKAYRMTGTVHDITESRQAADKIREDEAKFRSLVEQNIAGIIIIRDDSTIGYVNPLYAKWIGYPVADLIGRPVLDLVADADKEDVREKLRRQLASSADFLQFELTVQASDGHPINFLINASQSIFEGRPASILVLLDVTDRKQAAAALRVSEARYSDLFGSTRDAIVALEPLSGRFIAGNPSTVKLFGAKDEAEFLSRKPWEHSPERQPDGRPSIEKAHEMIETAMRVGANNFEWMHKRVDGMEFPADVLLTRVVHGNETLIYATVRDITERKAAEHALRRLNRTLRTLSRGNEALVHAASEAELLSEMCQVMVDTGGYRMAWVGVPEQDDAKSVTPIAWAGIGDEFFEGPPLHSWAGQSQGGCVCGLALNSGQAQTSQNLPKDPAMMLWRARFARHGIGAAAAFPLRNGTDVFGVLVIYAAEADAFDTDELKVLQELANDLAFGVGSLRDRREHEALTQRWRTSLEATVSAIANTVEMRDPYTSGHQQRVARLAVTIAGELRMPEHQTQGLYLAGIVHDVGKIDIPSEILNRPGRLSKLQFQLIQGHAQAGYDIIKGVDFPWPIARMVLQHHERLDGSGYPQGLKGDQILPEARIAIADVVEAMMSHRPYRAALGIEAALAEIEQGKGRLYDPAAVEACIALFRHKGFSFEERAVRR